MTKKRVDDLMVERHLAKDRDTAQRLVMAGKVSLSHRRVEHGSELLPDDTPITVAPGLPYVSRGGLKLDAALRAFSIETHYKTALDLGMSTGGFTDCLLQHGADHVIGVDVGHDQVAFSLRHHPKITLIERMHIKDLTPSHLPFPFNLVTIDLSFIPLTRVLPEVSRLIKDSCLHFKMGAPDFEVVCLHKPQFEVTKDLISKGGIVRDETSRLASLENTLALGEGLGWGASNWIPSPICGQKGNQEYLVYWKFTETIQFHPRD